MRLDTIKCQYCDKKSIWIPIADRKPANPGDYLVQLRSGIITVLRFENAVKFWDEKVIAWQPLPDKYVEDSNIGSSTL